MNSIIKDFFTSFGLMFSLLALYHYFFMPRKQSMFANAGRFVVVLLSTMMGMGLVNYFFVSREPVDQTGQPVAAPKTEIKPLHKEIDFVDIPAQITQEVSEVETDYAHFEFSSQGARLQSLQFKRHVDGKEITLTTITPPAEFEREKSFFLVALQEQTPFYYTLKSRTDDDQITRLTYAAQAKEGTVEKVFTIYKHTCQVDLALTLNPGTGQMQPRIFFSSPLLEDSKKAEHVAGVVQEPGAHIATYEYARKRYELEEDYWLKPSLFGAQDRYFVNVMVKDQNNFAQRGYYSTGVEEVRPILEGPLVNKPTTWLLSFYLGPKEHGPMSDVDSRLEVLLNYGWLGFLAKPMLLFMKWINGYVHSFGLAIIIFTCIIRLLLLPLTVRGAKGQEKVREMQKKLQYIRQRYKNDPQALEREQAELYKKYGLEGLGGLSGGCLPLLLQLPIFFAMNRVLSSSIELYKAPFLWISDLSVKDPYFILPALVTVSMIAATAQTADAQQKISGFIMAIIFGAFSAAFSAGLSLYFFVSTALGSLQAYAQKLLRI